TTNALTNSGLGSLSLIQTAQTISAAMNVNANLTGNGGNINIINQNTGGSITVANNVSISTNVTGTKNVGVVTISVGSNNPAATNPQTSGTGITVNSTGGGRVFFGPNQSRITGGGTGATVNAFGTNVVFFVGTAAGSIGLN